MKHFKLGQTLMTRGVNDKIAESEEFAKFVSDSFYRYLHNDWGELCKEDAKMNDSAVENNNDRIFASYENDKYKIWIITEYDRSSTTILFPSEY